MFRVVHLFPAKGAAASEPKSNQISLQSQEMFGIFSQNVWLQCKCCPLNKGSLARVWCRQTGRLSGTMLRMHTLWQDLVTDSSTSLPFIKLLLVPDILGRVAFFWPVCPMTPCLNRLMVGRGYKTTPNPLLAIFDPWGGFMPPRGGVIPPFGGVGLFPHRGGFIPPFQWFYPPFGGGGVSPF